MSDVQSGTDEKRSGSAIAKREWINDSGEKVVAGSPEAVGFRYTFLASGKSVDYIIGEAGKLSTMFGILGGLTKIGNIVNTIVNADSYAGEDPMTDVSEWLKEADAGQWREPGEGGAARGPKYDKDVLAAALLEYLTTVGDKPQGDVAHYRAKLDDKSYYAKVRARVPLMAIYYKLMAAKGSAVADQGGLA